MPADTSHGPSPHHPDPVGKTDDLPEYLRAGQLPRRSVTEPKYEHGFRFKPASMLVVDGSKGISRLARRGLTPRRLAAHVDPFTPDAQYQGQRRAERALTDEVLGPKLREDFGLGANERVPRLLLKEMGGRLLLAELLANTNAELAGRQGGPALSPTSSEAIAGAYDAINRRHPVPSAEISGPEGLEI